MARSEAQSGPSKAGNKRPQDKSSKETPPSARPRSSKQAEAQREQIEGEPQRLTFHADSQQNVQGQKEPPVVDMQPEPQPAPEMDRVSILSDLSDHGSAASAKLHEEINGHKQGQQHSTTSLGAIQLPPRVQGQGHNGNMGNQCQLLPDGAYGPRPRGREF